MKFLASIITSILAAVGIISYGAFNFVSSGTYTLATPISATQTTIPIDNFLKPVSNTQYVMATDFGSIGYMTIEPGSVTKKEFISFTGFSYSGNRATLSGVTRGLEFNYPYTSSTTLQQSHGGGAKAIISNPPQLYNQLAVKQNDEWITGTWGFGTLPTTSVACTDQVEFCNKAYIDGISIQGAPTSTESNLGVVELTTGSELADGTASSSSGAPLVLLNKYATTTPGTLCTSGTWNCIVAAASGKISQTWLDLTQHFNFASIFATNASSTNATTTNLSVTSGYTYFRSVLNLWPSSQGAQNTFLKNDGSGNLSWGNPTAQKYVLVESTDLSAASGFATSSSSLLIPGGTLNASSTIEVRGTMAACTSPGSGSGTAYLRTSTGTTLGTLVSVIDSSTDTGYGGSGWLIVGSNGSNTFSSQKSVGSSWTGVGSTPSTFNVISNENTSSIDFTQNVTLVVVVQTSNCGTVTLNSHTIVVNP